MRRFCVLKCLFEGPFPTAAAPAPRAVRKRQRRRRWQVTWSAADKKHCAKNAYKKLSCAALVQSSVPEHFMTKPLNFFFQMRLPEPEFDEHLAVAIRAMEQGLFDFIFEPFKISNEGWVRHIVLHDPECHLG
jgi:hypothetical protein